MSGSYPQNSDFNAYGGHPGYWDFSKASSVILVCKVLKTTPLVSKTKQRDF